MPCPTKGSKCDRTRSTVEKAEDRLDTAELLLENRKHESVVSEAYCVMFYTARALLLIEGSRPTIRAGTATELGNPFRDRMDRDLLSDFSRIRQLREDADYEVETDVDREAAADAVDTAEQFLDAAMELLTDQ